MTQLANGQVTKNFVVSADLWKAAQETVHLRGDPSVSHILRTCLTQYVRSTGRCIDDIPPRNRGERGDGN